MTTAAEIAIRFGREWEDANGVSLFDAMKPHLVAFDYDRNSRTRRYTLADYSVIVTRDEQWDIGRYGCFCAAHTQHQAGCVAVAA